MAQYDEEDDSHPVKAFISGVGNGGTLGFGDKAGGALQAALLKLSGDPSSFGDNYSKATEDNQAETDKLRSSNPYAYFAGDVAGGAVPQAVGAVATGGSSIPLQMGLGAAAGLGNSREETLAGKLDDMAIGAGGGAAAGKLGQAVARKLNPAWTPTSEALAENSSHDASRNTMRSNLTDLLSPEQDEKVAEMVKMRDIKEAAEAAAKKVKETKESILAKRKPASEVESPSLRQTLQPGEGGTAAGKGQTDPYRTNKLDLPEGPPEPKVIEPTRNQYLEYEKQGKLDENMPLENARNMADSSEKIRQAVIDAHQKYNVRPEHIDFVPDAQRRNMIALSNAAYNPDPAALPSGDSAAQLAKLLAHYTGGKAPTKIPGQTPLPLSASVGAKAPAAGGSLAQLLQLFAQRKREGENQ